MDADSIFFQMLFCLCKVDRKDGLTSAWLTDSKYWRWRFDKMKDIRVHGGASSGGSVVLTLTVSANCSGMVDVLKLFAELISNLWWSVLLPHEDFCDTPQKDLQGVQLNADTERANGPSSAFCKILVIQQWFLILERHG